jgi:hypothetical protein
MTAANPNAPFGLRVARHRKGGIVRLSEYTIASAYGTSLFLGDPVLCTGNGTDIGIAVAGTSNKITGVFAGCEYINSVGDTIWSKFWPSGTVQKANTIVKCFVIDDPDVMFEVMFDTLAVGDVRALANLVAGAGSTFTGLSGWTAAHPPGAGENQVKIMAMPTSETNPGGIPNNYGAFAVAQILIGQHELVGNLVNL